MNLNVVVGIANHDLIGKAIAEKFPNEYQVITSETWLVASNKTPQEISNELGITDGHGGVLGIVFLNNGYFGRASMNIWPWMKTKAEA